MEASIGTADHQDGGAPQAHDVAIVGYGPTGMVLAALLGAQGHRVIVLERYAGLYNLPRAATFDDETMRLFQKLGITDQVARSTEVQTTYEWVNADGEILLEVHYDDPAGSGWAAMYMMYQPELETVLDRTCRSLPTVQVRQGVTVDGLDVGPDEVQITGVDLHGRRHRVRASYVIGCDGGTSFMRSRMGAGLSDYGFSENWLVCDFHKRRALDTVPEFRQICDPVQPMSIVRLGPEHHRFSFMLDRDEQAVRATEPARVWDRVSRFLDADDADLIRVANYVFRSRIVDRWRDGRLMLAGDAAHEMPPFLGQGMCSGIRDAHNLAWKLNLVLTDRAREEILDTYQPEREPHVRFITEKGIELGRVQTLRDPEAARARDERFLALRHAEQAPDTIVLPGLSEGLLATDTPHAGTLFPQGTVRAPDGDERRLEDVVGSGPMLVGRSDDAVALDEDAAHRWRVLGGDTVAIDGAGQAGANGATVRVADRQGVYGAWFDAHPCQAALVRPDRYLYGTVDEDRSASELVRRLGQRLGARSSTPGRA